MPSPLDGYYDRHDMSDTAPPSLSVVIPTLNASARLPSCLAPLQAWPHDLEIIVVDGGSADTTVDIVRKTSATLVSSPRGRGRQLRAGANDARNDWLLFLHADTVLDQSWVSECEAFIANPDNRRHAAAFRFALDDESPQARRVERMVAWRCRVLGLPYGDQGLLIHRDFYDELGGFQCLPLMEDVDLVRRIGKNRIHLFQTRAVTSGERYRRNGWWARPSRNLFCLFLYMCGVPPRWIAKLYG